MEETFIKFLFEKMSCDLKNEKVLIFSVYDTRIHLQISTQLHVLRVYIHYVYL